MSTFKQAILDLKKTEKEARLMAEQQLLREGKSKLDEIVSKLMEELSPANDNDDDEEKVDDDNDVETTPTEPIVEPSSDEPTPPTVDTNTDTRNVGGEFSDFLSNDLGNDKPIEIEITIDTNPDKEETAITPTIKTDVPVETPTSNMSSNSDIVGDDIETEDDIDKIMEKFNELMDDDDVVVLKDKGDENIGLDDIMKETQTNSSTDTIYNEKEDKTSMETTDKEIMGDLEAAKKLSETEKIDAPETKEGDGFELNEEDIMKMMESFTEEEMADITKSALEELWNPNADDVSADYDGLDKTPIAEVMNVDEDVDLAGLPEEAVNAVKTMKNMGIDEESIERVIQQFKEKSAQPVSTEIEEGMSGSVSFANARHAGDSQTSYTKIENSRLSEDQLKTIKESFDKVSKLAKKLEDDNKTLKTQIGTLNESKVKLEESVSKYEGEILKYKEKFYEVVLEAKKASSVNKLLLENSTTASEKQRIVETFQNLKTRAEVDTAFGQLNENFKNEGVTTLNESTSINEIGNKTTKVFSTGSAKIVESTIRQIENPDLAKMMKHINYGKKTK